MHGVVPHARTFGCENEVAIAEKSSRNVPVAVRCLAAPCATRTGWSANLADAQRPDAGGNTVTPGVMGTANGARACSEPHAVKRNPPRGKRAQVDRKGRQPRDSNREHQRAVIP